MLIDRLNSTLLAWKTNLLSIGGRLTIIKLVLGSIRIYYMSIFKVPEMVIKVLEHLHASFFWGATEDNKKLAWIIWSNVLASFDTGGRSGKSYSFQLFSSIKVEMAFVEEP